MKNNYFNSWEFSNAVSIAKNDPIEALARYEEYSKKYPKDYTAYPYYASTLITLGKFKEAEKLLNYSMNLAYEDTKFCEDAKKIKFFNHSILYVKFRLLIYLGKYDDVLKIYEDNHDETKDMDLNSIDFFCRIRAGKTKGERNNFNTYLFKQVVEYREEDFLEHIKKHLDEYNIDVEEPNLNVFVANFPIYDVINEIKKYIPSKRRICSGFYEDTYVFKYDGCGRDNNKLSDYFKVICFHDTSNFITIIPVFDCQNLPYTDLNYMVKEDINVKVKRKSQIDKFRDRYNKK